MGAVVSDILLYVSTVKILNKNTLRYVVKVTIDIKRDSFTTNLIRTRGKHGKWILSVIITSSGKFWCGV